MAIETVGLELQDLKDKIIRYEHNLTMYKQELMQCLKDFDMWKTAHGSEYPMRRIAEVQAKLEEIEKP